MCCSIVSTIPWGCGERSCPAQWHLSNYWINADGCSVDRYGDGDHDDCDGDDIPTWEDECNAWREYAEWVLATGLDPLGNYMVKHNRKTKERWRFKFANSILGITLFRAHRGVQSVSPLELPEYIRDYLLLKPINGRFPIVDMTWQDFCGLDEVKVGRDKLHASASCLIECETPRAPQVVQRELKAAARKHLADLRKTGHLRMAGTLRHYEAIPTSFRGTH